MSEEEPPGGQSSNVLPTKSTETKCIGATNLKLHAITPAEVNLKTNYSQFTSNKKKYIVELLSFHPPAFTGPELWGVVSQHCSGKSQSPINIVTRRMRLGDDLTSFDFSGYQEAFHGRLVNTGHSVQLDLPVGMRIKGGNLTTPYKAVQLHLHWGKDGGPGSEHTIDGEQFPMEMHIVHIKEEYNSVSQAVRDSTGVAVLGFFFQKSKSANNKFDPLLNALKYITQPTNSTTLKGVSLEMLTLPEKNMTKYFRYHGSLTTPNCAEAVIWSLFENTVPLSSKQLAAFAQLQFSSGKPMVQTYRPVQPLSERQVSYSRGHLAQLNKVLLLTSVLVCTALSLSTSFTTLL
ncbi:carbonic anhydrase 4b [Pseudoliparis swirei]|uniref:carbonic anhydrase 4b n=1 Tax=Pseudoliparis swirei TaxID=2059687 RepID=UPI0024BE4241|nr:carbonic anhydrase 4b [Pseudoliparis swirei]